MPLPIIAAGAFSAIIATSIRFLVGSFIVKIFAMLAISLVTFTSINAVGELIADHLTNNMGAIPGEFVTAASMLGIFDAVNIVISAYLGALAIRQIMGMYNRVTFGRASN